jgi:hypothetical protein
MLLYIPMSGGCMRKAGPHPVTGLPELRYVKYTNFVINYSATTLEDADRYAHEYTLSGQNIRRAIESGRFCTRDDFKLTKPAMNGARHSRTSDVSDSRSPSEHDDDANYEIAEYHINLELEADYKGRPPMGKGSWKLLPYVVLVEKHNQEILAVRRNWEANDAQSRKIIWFAHHKFFPGLGFYGWGYPHVIGSLAKACNDGVNAVYDAAYAATFQGGFITKEGKAAGMAGEIRLEHGVWKALDGTFDEINKALYTPPFKEPSPALAKTVELCIDAFRRFASTSDAAVGDANPKGTPVGTIVALIEQSSVIPTAIHKRLHVSMGHELQMWARLVSMYMPNRYDYEDKASQERYLLKKDFDGAVDVVPVSDPNIFSQTQRIALCQGVLQLQAEAPDLYPPMKRVEGHRRMLQAMRVPDWEGVGPELQAPKYLDPVAEFQVMLVGGPVKAFEPQDHAGHLAVHANQRAHLLGSPSFVAMQPERQQMILGALDAHDADHMALDYRRRIMATANVPLPPIDETGQAPELPPELEAKVTAAVARMLPPPPPPVQGPNGGDDTIAKTQAAIKAKAMEAEAAIARDDRSHEADERRKQAAWFAEEGRKQKAHAQELQHESEKTQAGIIRDGAKAKLGLKAGAAQAGQKLGAADAGAKQKLRHTEQAAGQQLRHKEVGAQQDRGIKVAGAKQDLAIKRVGAQQEMANKDAGARQDRDIKGKAARLDRDNKAAGAAADRTEKGKSAAQERRLTDSKAKQEMRLTEQEHQQGTQHTEEEHKQAVRILEEDHAQQAKHTEQDHKLESQQTRESGKLKLAQTKEQLAAKKAARKKAAKKTTAKK